MIAIQTRTGHTCILFIGQLKRLLFLHAIKRTLPYSSLPMPEPFSLSRPYDRAQPFRSSSQPTQLPTIQSLLVCILMDEFTGARILEMGPSFECVPTSTDFPSTTTTGVESFEKPDEGVYKEDPEEDFDPSV